MLKRIWQKLTSKLRPSETAIMVVTDETELSFLDGGEGYCTNVVDNPETMAVIFMYGGSFGRVDMPREIEDPKAFVDQLVGNLETEIQKTMTAERERIAREKEAKVWLEANIAT